MSIIEGHFEEYVQQFMKRYFPKGDYPTWCVEALQVAGIHLLCLVCRKHVKLNNTLDKDIFMIVNPRIKR